MPTYSEDDLIKKLTRAEFQEVYEIYIGSRGKRIIHNVKLSPGRTAAFSQEDVYMLESYGWTLDEFSNELRRIFA